MEDSEVVLYDWIQLPSDWDSDVNTGELTTYNDLEPMTLFSAISSRLGSLLRYSGLTTQGSTRVRFFSFCLAGSYVSIKMIILSRIRLV